MNISTSKMIIGRGLSAISHTLGFDSYLFYCLRNIFSKEDVIGNDAIFNAVGKSELAQFRILSPDSTLIEKFNEIAKGIDDKISVLDQSQRLLNESRNKLLSRLMSGKIDLEPLDIQIPPSMHEEPLPQPKAMAYA